MWLLEKKVEHVFRKPGKMMRRVTTEITPRKKKKKKKSHSPKPDLINNLKSLKVAPKFTNEQKS